MIQELACYHNNLQRVLRLVIKIYQVEYLFESSFSCIYVGIPVSFYVSNFLITSTEGGFFTPGQTALNLTPNFVQQSINLTFPKSSRNLNSFILFVTLFVA